MPVPWDMREFLDIGESICGVRRRKDYVQPIFPKGRDVSVYIKRIRYLMKL